MLYPVQTNGIDKWSLHRFLNARVEQPTNCHLEFNTTVQLNNITTPDNNDTERGMFQLTRVPVLSNVRAVVTFFSSIIVLVPNGNFWIVTLLHSVSGVILGLDTVPYLIQNNAADKSSLNEARYHTALYRVQIGANYSNERSLLKTKDSTETFLPNYNVIQSH